MSMAFVITYDVGFECDGYAMEGEVPCPHVTVESGGDDQRLSKRTHAGMTIYVCYIYIIYTDMISNLNVRSRYGSCRGGAG